MSFLTKRHSFVTLITIGIILLIFWSTWLYFHRLAWRVREQALEDKLRKIGSQLIEQIKNDDASLVLEYAEPGRPVFDPEIIPSLTETIAYDQLTTHLLTVTLNPRLGLSQLMMLDGSGQVLFDANEDYFPGDSYLLNVQESLLLESAMQGMPQISRPTRQNVFKYGFFPLKNSKGRVVALLRLETQRTFFQQLDMLQNRLRFTGLLVTGLLLALGFVQYRTLKKLSQMEHAVAQKDRLRSLGTLSAGLAHEMKNPLGIMRATAEEIQFTIDDEKPERPEELKGLTGDLIGEIDRLNSLLNQVLEFSKPQDHFPEENPGCDLNGVLDQVLPLVSRNRKDGRVEFETIQNVNEAEVSIDPNALRQVLLNLLINAADAIDEEGVIRIITDEIDASHLSLLVVDNGEGIPDKVLNRIFDPFFSTKDKGTGLGLSITKQIVERNGGEISIQSKPGKGTQVMVILQKLMGEK